MASSSAAPRTAASTLSTGNATGGHRPHRLLPTVRRSNSVQSMPTTVAADNRRQQLLAADRERFLKAPPRHSHHRSPSPSTGGHANNHSITVAPTPPPLRQSRHDAHYDSSNNQRAGESTSHHDSVTIRCRSLLTTGACCGSCGAQQQPSAQRHTPLVSHVRPFESHIVPVAQSNTQSQLHRPVINTARLPPTVRASAKAIVSLMSAFLVASLLQFRITPTGDVWAEFLSQRDVTRITLVMTVTGDGRTIIVFRPDANACTARTDAPPPLDPNKLEKFTPATLPSAYAQKYAFIVAHVERVRGEVCKVTHYGTSADELAKCVLYESGLVRVFSRDGTVEYECTGDDDGRVVRAFRRTSVDDRVPIDAVDAVRTRMVLKECEDVRAIERALDTIYGTRGKGFPAVIGHRRAPTTPKPPTPHRSTTTNDERPQSSTRSSNSYKENRQQPLSINNSTTSGNTGRRPLAAVSHVDNHSSSWRHGQSPSSGYEFTSVSGAPASRSLLICRCATAGRSWCTRRRVSACASTPTSASNTPVRRRRRERTRLTTCAVRRRCPSTCARTSRRC